jgi:hypothetical protein
MPKTYQLNVRVDPNIREALERVSLERQQPLSYILRQLMMWFLHYYDRAPDRAMAEIASAPPPRPRVEETARGGEAPPRRPRDSGASRPPTRRRRDRSGA